MVFARGSRIGLVWHRWNSTDLGLIETSFTNLNAEIVVWMLLLFKKSRHKPNLESIVKYGISPDFGVKKNGGVLSMRPALFSPYRAREERRIQGLDEWNIRSNLKIKKKMTLMSDEKSPQLIKKNRGGRRWYEIFHTYPRTWFYRLHSHIWQYIGTLVGHTWLFLLNSPCQIHNLLA